MKFYKGMRRDTAHVDQPQDSYRRARNIILDHTTLSVRTEGALDILTSVDPEEYTIGNPLVLRTLCGIISLPQDKQLAIFHNVTDDTNELFLVQNLQYELIFTSGDYSWRPEYPIKGVAYEDSRGDVIVVWTDGENRPVYTNVTADTIAVYDLFPEVEFPNVKALPVAANQAGEIANGTYSFFIAYEVDKDNLTPFSPSYGAFKVGHGISDKDINTQVGLRFVGLDTTYSNYRIYAIRNRNEVLDSFYLATLPTSQTDFIWTGQTGTENISIDQLTIPAGWYTSVETLTVLDDRLYLANVRREDVFDGQAIADNIQLVWSIDGSSKWVGAEYIDDTKKKNWGRQYNNFLVGDMDNQTTPANPDHFGMSMGYMPGCSYAFYIAFLLKDGSWSQAYHIDAGALGPAAVEAVTLDGFPTLGSDEYHGTLGSKSNGEGSNLHVMPEPYQIHEVISEQDIVSQYYTGRTVDNLWAMLDIGVGAKSIDGNEIIPADIQPLVQGYSLFYAKPNANSRDVLGYVPYIEGSGYIPQTDAVEGDESNPYWTIYDPYLMSQKPRLNNFDYTIAYNGTTYSAGTNSWDLTSLVPADEEITDPDFEYLPGNSNGVDFNNDNRENRLCVDRGTLSSFDVGYKAEVKGNGDEGSRLKFGSNAPVSQDIYIDEGSDYAFFKVHKSAVLPSDYYTELDNVQLCACSYIEKTLTSDTMRQVSWGGDAIAHPVRHRVMKRTATPSNFPELRFTGQERIGPEDNDVLYSLYQSTQSYFTWSYVLQGYEDLTDPTVLTEEAILVYTDANVNYVGSPEIMNPYAIPVHTFAKNVLKSAFTSNQDDPVYNFPNRITRSFKQNYESNAIQWRRFAVADYYDNALNKGPIQNIESYAGELIVHHTDGIFKTMGKETLSTSAASVFVGSGDIFRAPPQELLPTEEGYAGLRKHTDAALTKGGYVFVDAMAGKVFKLDSSLSDLSQKGMKNYFRDQFRVDLTQPQSPYTGNGYAIGYDPEFDRIIISLITNYDVTTDSTEFKTISFSLLSDCWASHHTYPILAYATNRTSVMGFTGARFVCLNVGDNTAGAYIEPIFNQSGSTPKVFQSFQFVTRSTEGEGDWNPTTFDNAIVYNDRGCSGVRVLTNNVRWVEEAWNFNDFRNLVADADQGDSFFDDNDELIIEIDINKPWYAQQRIRGGYAGLRLIVLPSGGRTLYLSEALATFRVSYR